MEAIAHIFRCARFAPGFTAAGRQSEKRMKRLIMAVGLISLFACQAIAGEHSALARVTVYERMQLGTAHG
jgi:hypothetical protein